MMKLETALAKEAPGGVPVIWLDGAACTGCTMSLANSKMITTVEDLLIETLDANYIKTLMTAAGAYVGGTQFAGCNSLQAAQDTYLGTGLPVPAYVLVVEGAIQCAAPAGGGSAGDYCEVGDLTGDPSVGTTMLKNVQALASNALAVIGVGTCASFGGIPGARGNVTDGRGLLYKGTTRDGGALMDSAVGGGSITNILGMPIEQVTVNIPGCPPHPDWIVGTIAHIVSTLGSVSTFLGLLPDTTLMQQLLKEALPTFTNYQRPVDYGYREYQCNAGPCPWRYNNTQTRAKNTDPLPGSWQGDPSPYPWPSGYTMPATVTSYTGYGPAGTNAPSTSYSPEVDYNGRYPLGDSKMLGRVKWDDSKEGLAMGCLGILGCKGRKTKADCSRRRWNTAFADTYGVNWCVGSRGNCHGCTEPTFPDKSGKFYTFV
jgi:Ni,Fe-hydrogenase I small subunit